MPLTESCVSKSADIPTTGPFAAVESQRRSRYRRRRESYAGRRQEVRELAAALRPPLESAEAARWGRCLGRARRSVRYVRARPDQLPDPLEAGRWPAPGGRTSRETSWRNADDAPSRRRPRATLPPRWALHGQGRAHLAGVLGQEGPYGGSPGRPHKSLLSHSELRRLLGNRCVKHAAPPLRPKHPSSRIRSRGHPGAIVPHARARSRPRRRSVSSSRAG